MKRRTITFTAPFPKCTLNPFGDFDKLTLYVTEDTKGVCRDWMLTGKGKAKGLTKSEAFNALETLFIDGCKDGGS
jgi:hypothetical protein